MAATAAETAKRQRAYASGVALSLSPLLSVLVDLAPKGRQGREDGTGLNRLCAHPDHKHPVRTNQMYVCTDNPAHVLRESETLRGAEVDKHGMVALTDGQVAEAVLDGMETSLMSVVAFPADQVESQTRPTDAGFRVRPPTKAPLSQHKVIDAIARVVADHPELAFLGELVLRSSRNLYRLTVWRDQLYLQGLTIPDDLEPAADDELPQSEASHEDVSLLESLMTAEVGTFGEGLFAHDDRAKVAAALAAAAKEGKTATAAPAVADPLAAIRESIKVSAPKPKPTKKAAAKKTAAKKATARKKVA